MTQFTDNEMEQLKGLIVTLGGLEDYFNPTSSILPFAGQVEERAEGAIVPAGEDPKYAKVPKGWLLCDGREISEAEYPELHKSLEDSWGDSGEFTFKIPELSGRFLRGVSNATYLGEYQEDEFMKHFHTIPSSELKGDHVQQAMGAGYTALNTVKNQGNFEGNPRISDEKGGDETRPKNASIFWIIKI